MTDNSIYINTWQSILWRLLVTAVLLLILAGSSITIVTPSTEANAYMFAPVSQQENRLVAE